MGATYQTSHIQYVPGIVLDAEHSTGIMEEMASFSFQETLHEPSSSRGHGVKIMCAPRSIVDGS